MHPDKFGRRDKKSKTYFDGIKSRRGKNRRRQLSCSIAKGTLSETQIELRVRRKSYREKFLFIAFCNETKSMRFFFVSSLLDIHFY